MKINQLGNIRDMYENLLLKVPRISIKRWLQERDDKRRHKLALKFMRNQYMNEMAAYKITEDYQINLITDYPGEDANKAQLRNGLVELQKKMKNLELLIAFLRNAR